jgi:hypothetical protein
VVKEFLHDGRPLTVFERDTLQPLLVPICPLCDQANACVGLAGNRFDVECWCNRAAG